MIKIAFNLITSLIFTLVLSSNSFANTVESFELTLAQHKGKVVYLDFWASWCGPCRKSFPWMNDMQAKYKEQGLVVISINVDNEKELATEFLSENPANFSVVYDPKGIIARQYKVRGMPSSYLINKNGQLVSSHAGFTSSKTNEYEQEITELLKL